MLFPCSFVYKSWVDHIHCISLLFFFRDPFPSSSFGSRIPLMEGESPKRTLTLLYQLTREEEESPVPRNVNVVWETTQISIS